MKRPSVHHIEDIDLAILGVSGKAITIGVVSTPGYEGAEAVVTPSGEMVRSDETRAQRLIRKATGGLSKKRAADDDLEAPSPSGRPAKDAATSRQSQKRASSRFKLSLLPHALSIQRYARKAIVVVLVTAGLGACILGAAFIGSYYIGQEGTPAATETEQPFAISQPIAVKIDAPAAAASAASEAPSELVPAHVAAAASLRPLSELPVPVDEAGSRAAKQSATAAQTPAPRPAAVKDQLPTAEQPPAQAKPVDQLIAIHDDQVETKRSPSPSPPQKVAATQPAAANLGAPQASSPNGQIRKAKYGDMGITALTSTGVIVVSRKSGQAEIVPGMPLPDGSIIRNIDPKNHRITTDKGVLQLD